jgi:hypothetical protein
MGIECQHLKRCAFFGDRMPDNKGLGAMYKQTYCLGSNASCARFMVAQAIGGKNVPMTLYPNMVDDAHEILQKYGFEKAQ